MKRFLFAGLFLAALTLFSCSRKKQETQVPAQDSVPVSAQVPAQAQETQTPIEVEETAETSPEYEEFAAEEERMGTEVLDFLEDESNFSSPIIETEEGIPEAEPVEKRLLDSYNRLKVMEYGTEVFLPVNKEDSSVLIHYSNKAAVRLFYDELFRLTKKERWKMDSVETAELSVTERYNYDGSSKNPYEKIIETKDTIFVSKLNENGLVIRTEKYSIDESQSLSTKERSLSLSKGPIQTTVWTYDDKNRITSETVSEGTSVKKQLYNYAKSDRLKTEDSDELPPDYEYYENGALITKTEYKEKGVYSTTIWFDSTSSVRTDYENYVKVRDVYFTNGVERRVKNYE